ncbi:tetratricopeptide repeat protein [Pseudoduganella violaceinigra]|uniref:tetratricopeptide repeat protein n=1 Tax=Pseudoduganella violaceinigra TaxID=246602 RepID=UPI000424E78D|nr:tetratricopeptide repeat protein [Pseudoduganella violaceinigra]
MKKLRGVLFAFGIALGLQSGAHAGFAEGATAYNNKNYALAYKEILPLAKAGNTDAEHLLGLMYYMGRGVPQDYKLALAWHRKAASKGKADAQYVVGAMYYTGNAVLQDHKEAVTWFRKAAEQGHPDAQQVLGLMYRYHIGGMPQDNVLAYMLWNLAAAGGSSNAAEQRSSVARGMSPEQIEEGQTLSSSWRRGTPLPRSSRTGGG